MTFKMKMGWGYRNEMILLGLGREDPPPKKKVSFLKKNSVSEPCFTYNRSIYENKVRPNRL